MSATPRKARPERRRLDALVPYPAQDQFFDDLPEGELLQLAKALQEDHVEPPHILPKNKAGLAINTILRGHQRLRAARHNGAKQISVLVRYDLAGSDRPTVERAFLIENQNRRHQDPLTKARVALRLFELEKERPLLDSHAGGWLEDARDRVGKVLAMSGRNLQRYFNLLMYTPVEIQNAVRDRKLKLVVGERVALLGDPDKEEIVRRIRAGEEPEAVVEMYIAGVKGRNGGDPVMLTVRGLSRALRHVEQRIDELPAHHLRTHVRNLEHARSIIDALITRATT